MKDLKQNIENSEHISILKVLYNNKDIEIEYKAVQRGQNMRIQIYKFNNIYNKQLT